jgi:23S rRNA (pseudouridine1915-N3)-methyltransferase
MHLIIAAIGKLKAGPERELFERYRERLTATGRALGWGPVDIIEIPESRAPDAATRKSQEAERLLAKVGTAVKVILDENGRELTSQAFADYLRAQRQAGTGTLAFLIGGPDGHGQAMHSSADLKMSFGKMTLPHMLVRVLLAEQLYRAATILTGHPYHRN